MKKASLISLMLLCFVFSMAGSAYGQKPAPVIYPDDPMRDGPVLEGLEKQPMEKDAGKPIPPDLPILLSGDCSDFEDLTGLPLPIEVSGTTVGATNDYGPFTAEPECWTYYWYPQAAAGPDATFKWTAPSDGNYMISLCASNYDTGLLLYRFTCPEEPVFPDDFLCGNDDHCFLRSRLRDVSLSEGEEILIVVDGYGNNSGEFELSIIETPIDDIDTYIERQMEMYYIPGAAACIVKDGQIDWTGSYGDAIIENHIDVADTTLFMLASISKTITGVAVMQLWEDGLFDLDDDINDYLPFSVRNPNHLSESITFRMLATHTSSINDNWSILNSLRSWGSDPSIPLGEFMEGYLTQGGAYYNSNNFNSWAPGANYDYSNVGVALTAYLVEVISPDYDSFAQYCNENIFAPLGMDETSWYLADLDINNIAMPYYWNGSAYIPWGHYSDPWFPSASLRTSTLQLARHLTAFMQYGLIDDVRILDSTTVEMMKTVQHPVISPSFGLFWFWEDYGQRILWGHNGSYYGVLTRMLFHPEENTGVIILTSGDLASEAPHALWNFTYDLFEYAAGLPGFIAGVVTDESSNPIEHAYSIPIDSLGWPLKWDYTNSAGEYFVGGLITGTYDVHLTHPDFVETTITDITVTLGDTTTLNVVLKSIGYPYLPGDANMYNGIWPPQCIGSDVTYLVNYFRGVGNSCELYGFWASADANGDCSIIGSDVTRLVNYFRGNVSLLYCPDYEPLWPTPDDLPDETPDGWPGCE